MLSRLAARALAGFGVVAGVVTLTFFALRLAPGDPVEQLLGPARDPNSRERHALASIDRSPSSTRVGDPVRARRLG